MQSETEKRSGLNSLPPTAVSVFQPGDVTLGPNWRRTGLIFVHIRCNCRTRRAHGFNRCNRHITPADNFRGYRYCIQCREHRDDAERTAFQAAMQLRANWNRMRSTLLSHADLVQYTSRCSRDAIRDAPQDCHCDCAGCLGPEPQENAHVVSEILESPPKRVRRS